MIVGINGFGRVGKNICKILLDKNIQIGLINDPMVDVDYIIYSLKYDTVFNNSKIIAVKEGNGIKIGEMFIRITHEKEPKEIKWFEENVKYVVEASGVFNNYLKAMQHNAKVIVCTGPSKDIPMFVYGVKHKEIEKIKNDLNGKTILSAASCTTNCVAPILKMINDKYTIESGTFNTVHAVTASQNCVDKVAKLFRTGRCCFNIIPSTTGAAGAVEKILPELAGKLHGSAMRVPVPNVSVSDIVLNVKHEIESMDEIFEEIERNRKKYNNVLSISKDLCVSSDYIGSHYSCIVDYNASSCLINKKFIKLVCWYDNEHAYSCRVVDLIEFMENKM